jgi:hypothetical protein
MQLLEPAVVDPADSILHCIHWAHRPAATSSFLSTSASRHGVLGRNSVHEHVRCSGMCVWIKVRDVAARQEISVVGGHVILSSQINMATEEDIAEVLRAELELEDDSLVSAPFECSSRTAASATTLTCNFISADLILTNILTPFSSVRHWLLPVHSSSTLQVLLLRIWTR